MSSSNSRSACSRADVGARHGCPPPRAYARRLGASRCNPGILGRGALSRCLSGEGPLGAWTVRAAALGVGNHASAPSRLAADALGTALGAPAAPARSSPPLCRLRPGRAANRSSRGRRGHMAEGRLRVGFRRGSPGSSTRAATRGECALNLLCARRKWNILPRLFRRQSGCTKPHARCVAGKPLLRRG